MAATAVKSSTGDLPWLCGGCGARRAQFRPQCGGCGRWNTFQRAGAGSAVNNGQSFPALAPARRLDCADAAPNRLQSGVPWLDRVLGGGFVAGSTLLFWGGPGSGKSTCALEALFWTAVRAKRPGYYASGEEGMVQVRDRADRLGLSPSWIYFNHPCFFPAIERDVLRLKPCMVVVDSVQKLDDGVNRGGEYERAKRAFSKLLALLQRLRIPGILISQVNKAGEVSGGRCYEHDPDAVVQLRVCEDGAREVVMSKNRFGPIIEGMRLKMTATGLQEVVRP